MTASLTGMTDAMAGLERLRAAAADGSLAGLCGSRGVRLLVVFGSAVDRAAVRPPRDLDVAFARSHRGDGPPVSVVTLMDDLLQVTRINDVDLLDLDRADPVAKAAALLFGQPVFQEEDGAFAVAQMAAFGEFHDTEWMRRHALERVLTLLVDSAVDIARAQYREYVRQVASNLVP